MFDWASLRLTWEPRMLSILRIMVGLLYWQHGLNKLFNFPPTANHAAYNLFTLAPGLRRDGGGLFHGQCTERVLPTRQWWRVGSHLLLCIFIFLRRRRRHLEPRSAMGRQGVQRRRSRDPGLTALPTARPWRVRLPKGVVTRRHSGAPSPNRIIRMAPWSLS